MTQQDWVWFDLDDTLHDFSATVAQVDAAVVGLISTGTGLSADIVEANFRKVIATQVVAEFADGQSYQEYRRERIIGAMTGAALAVSDCEALIERALQAYDRVYMSSLRLKAGAEALLALLRRRGCKLAILTDAPQDGQLRVIEALGLSSLFDVVFTSGALRLSKSQGMMRVVLARLQVDPCCVTMIGDSIHRDVLPALDLGINALWFNDSGRPNPDGYIAVNSLMQVSDFVEA